MKVLIVEDEKELLESICAYLSDEHYSCEVATDYSAAIEKILMYDYACIVLDINLPDGSGLALLSEMKLNNKLDGVIIISARNSLDDKVYALKAGADDYLTKPFHLAELAARIAAIIRRKCFNGKATIDLNGMVVDLNAKNVKVQESLIELTKKEYELLLYFISNRNRVITKNAIAVHLWGDDMDNAGSYDFIYTHIKNLRKKLIHGGAPDYIRSVYGMGYKFVSTE
jgi:DNA-binding response OmpR family regulator